MASEGDLEVGESALRVRRAQRAHPVDHEAVHLNRLLETLQTVPCPGAVSSSYTLAALDVPLTSHAVPANVNVRIIKSY